MSSFRRLLLVCAAFAASATACATPRPQVPHVHPAWEVAMAAGLDASDVGRPSAAALHYRRALAVARRERLPAEELAFSAYRLGDLIRREPQLARGETALALLEEARDQFRRGYGPEHPVLIPVLARLARIYAEAGDTEASEAAREGADRIAVRFFPESHFLRERFGAARPAELVHPLEVLAMLGEDESLEPEQVVKSRE